MAVSQDVKVVLRVQDDGSGKLKVFAKNLESVGEGAEKGGLSFKKLTAAVALGSAIWDIASTAIRGTFNALKSFAAESIEAAGKYEQSSAVLGQLALNAGYTKEELDGVAQALRDQKKDWGTIVEVQKAFVLAQADMASATQAVSAARDVAATVNKSSNEVLRALTQSMLEGTNAALTQEGVIISMNAAVANYKNELNLGSEALTKTQRSQAILNEFLKLGVQTQGSYNAAMETWFKQNTSLKDGLNEVKIIFGDLLDDAMRPIIMEINKIIWSWRQFAFVNGELRPELKEMAQNIGVVLVTAFEIAKDAVKGMIAIIQAFAKGIGNLIAFLRPAMSQVADLLSWLNPFARHSPSLVERVHDGVAEIVNTYKKVDDIHPTLRKFSDVLQEATAELDNQKEALDEAKSLLSSYKDKLEDLNKVKLEGFGQFSDDLFAVEQQIKQAELDKLLAEQSGAGEKEIEKLDKALEDLKNQRDIMRLQFEIDTDPAVREIQKMKDAFNGLDQEMSFENLKTALKEAQDNVTSQTTVVATLETSYNSLKAVTDDLTAAFQEASSALSSKGGGGGGGSLDDALSEAGMAFEQFTPQADESMSNFQSKIEAAKAGWQNFKSSVGAGWAAIVGWLEERGIIDAFRAAWENLATAWNESLKPALENLFNAFKPLYPLLGDLVIMFGVAILGAIVLVINIIAVLVDAIGTVINWIAQWVDFMLTQLQPAITFVHETFQGFTDAMAEAISFMQNIYDWFKKIKDAFAKGISNPFSGIASSVKGIFGGGRASGGPVNRGTTYLVGEQGPELFTPSSNGKIIPNGAGGGSIVVNVTGNQISSKMDLDDIAMTIGESIMRQFKLQTRTG